MPNRALSTFVATSLGLFMVVLDNLVVTTALPAIRVDLDASLSSLEWTISAYTLTFAVLLLPAAAAGDRFGRKRLFVAGLAIFTAASAGAALAPGVHELVIARAIQGLGGALVMPLSLTILSEAVGREKRGVALGAWSGIAGLAVALGPLVGGAVVDGIAWEWIFWLNVPVGLIAIPLSLRCLHESHGRRAPLDLRGLALASAGLLGVVWALVNGNDDGWTSVAVLAPAAVGVALVAAFLAWEARTRSPMLPLRLFRDRVFAAANGASLLMYFGLFGSVFLLAQFFQTAQGDSPLEAGLRTLPWTVIPMVVAPLAGALSDRIGGAPLIALGLALQATALGWLAAVSTTTVAYGALIAPLVLGGIGTGLFYAPIANVVLSSVRPDEEGVASGINNALRELGGVFGVAVLAAVFAHRGGYASPQTFVDGFGPALWIGAGVVGAGSLVALAMHRRRAAAAAPGPALAVRGR